MADSLTSKTLSMIFSNTNRLIFTETSVAINIITIIIITATLIQQSYQQILHSTEKL